MANRTEHESAETPLTEAGRLLKWGDVRTGDRIVLEALNPDLGSSGEVGLVVMDVHFGTGHRPDVTLRLEHSGVRFRNSGGQPINLPEGTVMRAGPSGATHSWREGQAYFDGIQLGVGLYLEDVLEPDGPVSRKAVLHEVARIRLGRGAGDPDTLADETDEYRLRIEEYGERLREGR